MSDPIPSASTTDPTPSTSAPSTSAEDRKAAAALSSLNTTEVATDSSATPGQQQPSSADQEALGKAMSRLEMVAGGGKAGGTSKDKGTTGGNGNGNGNGKGSAKNEAAAKKAEEKRRIAAVKVSGEDVGLLVNELDLSKVKATELLKMNEGDAKKAIKAFIKPKVAA